MGPVLERSQVLMKDWPGVEEEEPGWKIRLEFSLICMVLAFTAMLSLYTALRGEAANAHPGGLAADGCHKDRKNGGRHCHGRTGASLPAPQQARGEQVYYRNCDAARAAGAAPVRRGDPGYARHLDRDGDGIGCE